MNWPSQGKADSNELLRLKTTEFRLNHDFQGLESVCKCVPKNFVANNLVTVPINVSGCCNFDPINLGVTFLQFWRQPSRRFGNDFQAPRHCVDSAPIRLEFGKGHPLAE